MSARPIVRGAAVRGDETAARGTHALSGSESAWLVLLPCTLLLLAAIVLLGPPLGRLLFAPPGDWAIWPALVTSRFVQPEPTEHARFAIALLGPLLVAGTALALTRRPRPAIPAAALATASQAALGLFLALAVFAQHRHVYERSYSVETDGVRMVVFTIPTLVVAMLVASAAAWAANRPWLTAAGRRMLRESRRRRAAAIAIAASFALLWLMTAFNTDATIGLANVLVFENISFWSDEAFAILGGLAPLVDFHAQYGHLWAYIAAGGLALLGSSLAVYAAIMLAGTAGTLAAVLATFRRLTGGWPAAVALFLPFTATSFFMAIGPLENRYGPANLFSLFPIRYGGPYLLLWLVVRRVQRGAQRPPVMLFALAGIVAINNLEFGVPAFGATLVALAATARDRSPRAFARLAAAALAGVAIAMAAVAALTLGVAGSLPHFGMLTTFPRIFGTEGFGLLPMPALGLHLVLYVTLGAALVLAALRAASAGGAPADPLTTALAWAGIFGLGASSYFVGRSHPHVLIDMLSAWALAISLLLIVVVRAVVRSPARRPQLAALLVLAGFGICICSLAQTPTPWSQIERLWDAQPPRDRVATVVTDVVRKFTDPGEPVALLVPLGHRIAYELGIQNVAPYASMDSMMTREQWDETIAALRRADGRRVIVPRPLLLPERIDYLAAAGYRPVREASGVGVVEFVADPRLASRRSTHP